MSAPHPLWDTVVGQERAVELLRQALVEPVHAYLFLGPAGSGKRGAARAFAAALLCRNGECGVCRDCTLALHGEHPDVAEIVRAGAAISSEQADDIVHRSVLAPVEGSRKVLILDEFHLLAPTVAAKLLKTIEEPPPSTVFCVLADQLMPDLITIASRCVRVPFRVLPDDVVAAALRADGISDRVALEAALAAAGDLDRARLLATDPGLFERRAAFASVPARLNGSGTRAAQLTDELLGLIDAAAEPLKARHARELADLEIRVAQTGERGAGRKTTDDRHKRELRRHRTDELRAGLGTIAAAYRDRLVNGVEGRRGLEDAEAVDHILRALEALERNPNETLLMHALLLSLPALAR
jgi:DNA polymerase-3 subunit delta'